MWLLSGEKLRAPILSGTNTIKTGYFSGIFIHQIKFQHRLALPLIFSFSPYLMIPINKERASNNLVNIGNLFNRHSCYSIG